MRFYIRLINTKKKILGSVLNPQGKKVFALPIIVYKIRFK